MNTPDNYLGNITKALHDSLEQDESVFLYGQDIEDPFGGAFKATKGLSTKFPNRVLNAPICEDAMAGHCIGAAISGLRPVLEYQFADFATIALSQLINHAATMYWRNGTNCPLTVRLPVGGTAGGGAFHSQMVEGLYTNHPGLIVCAPSNASDAYNMLRQAVSFDDPVIFCEHKGLYFTEKTEIEKDAPPFGKAKIVNEGSNCTVVSYSAMTTVALRAAKKIAATQGITIDIVDLRCLKPLDMETVLQSIQKTGRVVVLTESWGYAGVASEVISRITDEGFHLLDAPPIKVAAKETPIPYHPDLYEDYLPGESDLIEAVQKLVNY